MLNFRPLTRKALICAAALALAFQGSQLVRHAPTAVADAFCVGRLGDDRGRVYGTLPSGVDTQALITRALGG